MLTSEKCKEMAENFREAGNASFRNGSFHDALVLYNKSLCHAITNSELSIGYANRSAVYLKVHLFDKCLENIKLAKDHVLDSNTLPELHERKQKCKKLMKMHKRNLHDDPSNFFKLSYPPNKKVPFIVDSLELREDAKFGRYLITSCDLKTGDVIAIEEPFHKFIDSDLRYSRCTNCLKSNYLSLTPCSNCPSSKLFSLIISHFSSLKFIFAAMYCSDECKTDHENFIHLVECRKKPLPPVLLVCTKMILTAVDIAGSLDQLKTLLEESKSKTVFDFDLSDPKDPSLKKNLVRIVNSMAKSENSKIVITEKMKKTFNFPPFDKLWKTDEEREFLIDCFHNQLRIHNTNQLEMGEHTLEDYFGENFWYVKTIGSGLCPFASLFNHSCDANIKRTCIDNKIVFVVARPIRAGQQLFLSYGYSSHAISKDERQHLLQRYSFTCDCEACVKNYANILIRTEEKRS